MTDQRLRRATHRYRRLVCAATVATAALGGGAMAAPLKLPDGPYNYTVINQDLPVALLEFGSNVNVKTNVSTEVRGRLQGRLPEMSPAEFLDRLASLYNLEWYFDGQVLHVSSARESQTRLLVPGPVPFERLKATLDAFGVSDARFAAQPAPGANLVLVIGPPRFVAMVEQTLNALITEEQGRPKPAEAREEPPAPKDTVLTVYRGAQTTILRNGRPEFVSGSNEPATGANTSGIPDGRPALPPGSLRDERPRP